MNTNRGDVTCEHIHQAWLCIRLCLTFCVSLDPSVLNHYWDFSVKVTVLTYLEDYLDLHILSFPIHKLLFRFHISYLYTGTTF